MKAIVTGGAGFIGGHLCETLLQQGHTVSAIDDISTGNVDNIAHLREHPNFHFAAESITNELVMDRLASNADVIFHLAAAVGVDLIVNEPVRVIRTNILGTEAVLQAAKRYNCKILLASTSEIYGKSDKEKFNEEDDRILGPTTRSRWAYSSSKAIDEFLALAHHRESDLPIVIFRLFNTVGPKQSGQYGMVVPRFVRAALNGEPIRVFGDGKQSRTFLHVRDAVRGIVGLSMRSEAIGEVFNLGNCKEISILELAELIKEKTNSSSQIVFVPYDKAYSPGFEDMTRRLPDIAKIRATLGWVPENSLNDILDDIIAYEQSKVGLQLQGNGVN